MHGPLDDKMDYMHTSDERFQLIYADGDISWMRCQQRGVLIRQKHRGTEKSLLWLGIASSPFCPPIPHLYFYLLFVMRHLLILCLISFALLTVIHAEPHGRRHRGGGRGKGGRHRPKSAAPSAPS